MWPFFRRSFIEALFWRLFENMGSKLTLFINLVKHFFKSWGFMVRKHEIIFMDFSLQLIEALPEIVLTVFLMAGQSDLSWRTWCSEQLMFFMSVHACRTCHDLFWSVRSYYVKEGKKRQLSIKDDCVKVDLTVTKEENSSPIVFFLVLVWSKRYWWH